MLSTIIQAVVFALAVTTVFGGPDPALRQVALRKYDKGAIPGNGDNTVAIEVTKLTVNSIQVEEKDQEFVVNGWLHLTWSDPRLSWGPEVKDKDGYLHFSPDEVWIPDLAIFNGAEPKKLFDFHGKSDVIVGYNGSVLWVPPVKLRASCALNLRRWPYDTQECVIRLGSWTYDADSLNVTLGDDASVDLKQYPTLSNTEWNIDSTKVARESKEYSCCPGMLFPTVNFAFTVTRSSSVYSYTVILPIMMITVLNILIFFLPKHRGEKLTLGIFNFLIVSMFLLYFNNQLPVLSSAPLIVMLYGANLFFIAAILAVATMVINCTDGSHIAGTPKWINWIFNRTVASALCLRNLQKITNAKRDGRSYSFKAGTAGNGSVAVEEPLDPEQQRQGPKETDGGNKAEWYFLASVLDRIVLIEYIVISVFLMLYVHM